MALDPATRLTSRDILSKTFSAKTRRGYSPIEVDRFLRRVADGVDELNREIDRLLFGTPVAPAAAGGPNLSELPPPPPPDALAAYQATHGSGGHEDEQGSSLAPPPGVELEGEDEQSAWAAQGEAGLQGEAGQQAGQAGYDEAYVESPPPPPAPEAVQHEEPAERSQYEQAVEASGGYLAEPEAAPMDSQVAANEDRAAAISTSLQAAEEAVELLRMAKETADRTMAEARTRAEGIIVAARSEADEIVAGAQSRADEIIADATYRASEITREADRKAFESASRRRAEVADIERTVEAKRLELEELHRAVSVTRHQLRMLARQAIDVAGEDVPGVVDLTERRPDASRSQHPAFDND